MTGTCRAALATLLLAAAPARAVTPCTPPRCVDVAVPVPPDLIVPDGRVRVLLPVGYDPGGPGYPVVYLLHGAGDTFATWSQNTDVIDFSAAFPVIIVMPDGGHDANAGWYSDWKDGSRQWESFHIDVLIPFIDATFNTLGDGHRATMGLSMGGFGAMSYAARHAGLFQAAASFSGAVDTQYGAPASGFFFTDLHDMFGTPDSRVWGDQVQDMATWSAHNPTARAADLACVELFIASGDGAPGGPAGDDPSNPGGYALEQAIFQMNLSFVRALVVAGVPFHQNFYGGGYHGWPYWQLALHWALPQVVPIIAAGGTGGPCAPGVTTTTTSSTTTTTLAPGTAADHFQCYKARTAPGAPPFRPGPVDLTDRFASRTATVVRPEGLCTPVDKNGEGIRDAATYLVCYKAVPRRPALGRSITERNQFGDYPLAVAEPRSLCVPSGKDPLLPAGDLDHFQCYKARKSQGVRFQRRPVTLTDEFGTRTASVVRPDSLCVPVDKNGEGIRNPGTDLVCYKVVPRRPASTRSFAVRNQFGPDQLAVAGPRTLCVPSATPAP
jgi:diacylglycerol O-acyltransferase/trehalose O-mycolyltransferase